MMGLLVPCSLALEVLGDRWEAEEVIQDVFAYIWKKPEAYSPEKESLAVGCSSLLGTEVLIVYDLVNVVVHGEPIEALSNRQDHSSRDGVEQAVLADERENIKNAFAQLPADQKEVLELNYFKGLNHQEISDLLKLSLGTVKSRIRLGMEKLRRILTSIR